MFRFLHAADIHLDSPLQGLERYPDAPVEAVRAAPRRAFEALVELALEERVAFVLLAGDLYDGDWKDYNTGLFFGAQMRRLAEAGIPVHLVSGNHDAASQITKRLSLPPNVTHYASRRPETVVLPDLDVAIHGQSFPGRRVPEDLAAGYPTADPGRFEIGLLHTSLDGRPGHDRYAPCTPEGLRRKGYGYWALGHVHQREVHRGEAGDAWIVFPGNLQGRHARETGGKGATLVRVENGRVVDAVHRDLDVVRWACLEVDVADRDRPDDALAAIADALSSALADAEGRLLAARIVVTGTSGAHDALMRAPERWLHEIRSLASDLGEPGVWLERVELATRSRRDPRSIRDRDDALGHLLRRLDAIAAEPTAATGASVDAAPTRSLELGRAGEALDELKRKLPPGLLGIEGDGPERCDPADPEWRRKRLGAVREMLWSRLLEGEETV